MYSIPEKDWKILRTLKDELLAKACDEVFIKVNALSEMRSGCEHQSYLTLWELVQNENRKIAEMFDDLKRSNAILKISALKRYNILSEEQLCLFSNETQKYVQYFTQI